MSILTEAFKKLEKSILLKSHPVGSIYMSIEQQDPSEIFGGYWIKLENTNGYLRPADKNQVAGQTYGSNTVRLDATNIPRLEVRFDNAMSIGHSNGTVAGGYVSLGGTSGRSGTLYANAQNTTPVAVKIEPAYIAVHMWRRIG